MTTIEATIIDAVTNHAELEDRDGRAAGCFIPRLAARTAADEGTVALYLSLSMSPTL